MLTKRAQVTVPLFTFILIAFTFVIILGTFLFFFSTINAAFQGNLVAGAVNMTDASDLTIGQINSAYINSADLLGIFFLFGVIISIIFAGFLVREETPKLFFMVDFILVIFAYILAAYISNAYETILASLPFQSLIASDLNTTSRIILFLPPLTVITGLITMAVTYAGIPKRREELDVGGF